MITGQVFISYSRRDEAAMRRIVAFLRGEGINIWLDNEKLVPGTPIWETEIEKALRSSSAIVVILSPDSKDSEWVRREITLADQFRTRIFPVLVRGDEDSSISIRLVTRQFVDMRQNDEIGLKALSSALSFYLEGLENPQQSLQEEAFVSAYKDTAKNEVYISKSANATKPPFLSSRRGRTLMGGVLGIIISIIVTLINGGMDSIFYLAFPVVIGLTGLITLPNKLSLGILIVSFFFMGIFVVPGMTGSSKLEDFIALGALLGFPAGALVSRFLHWIKVLK